VAVVVAAVLICFAPPTRRRRPLYNNIIIIMYRFPRALYRRWWWVVGRRSSSGIRAEIHQWYSVAADYDVFVALEEEYGAVVTTSPLVRGLSVVTRRSLDRLSLVRRRLPTLCATITPSHRHCTVTDRHRHRLRLCH